MSDYYYVIRQMLNICNLGKENGNKKRNLGRQYGGENEGVLTKSRLKREHYVTI